MADEHGDGGSAVQPALQLGSIADVRRWLDTDCVSAQSAEVQGLREAVNILTRPKPRQEDVQRLLSRNNWAAYAEATRDEPKAEIQTERSLNSFESSAERPANTMSAVLYCLLIIAGAYFWSRHAMF